MKLRVIQTITSILHLRDLDLLVVRILILLGEVLVWGELLELLYYGEQLGLARALEVLYYGGWEPVLPHVLELVLLLELLESLAGVLQLELVLLVDV